MMQNIILNIFIIFLSRIKKYMKRKIIGDFQRNLFIRFFLFYFYIKVLTEIVTYQN